MCRSFRNIEFSKNYMHNKKNIILNDSSLILFFCHCQIFHSTHKSLYCDDFSACRRKYDTCSLYHGINALQKYCFSQKIPQIRQGGPKTTDLKKKHFSYHMHFHNLINHKISIYRYKIIQLTNNIKFHINVLIQDIL